MTMPVCAFMMPMGGRFFDNVGGQDVLIRRIRELQVNTTVCPWNKSNEAITWINNRWHGQLVFVVGVSCGANVTEYVYNQLGKRGISTSYAAMVQPSRWCVSNWMGKIGPTVKEALIIYASCWKTLGFGCYKPQLEQMPVLVPPDTNLYDGKKRVGNGGRTTVRWVLRDTLHPGDWDRQGAQDPILRDMARLMNGPVDVTKLMMRVN